MAAPKPYMGWPSRTAAVVAMRKKDWSLSFIAERMGISPQNVSALLASAKRSQSVAKGFFAITIEDATRARLRHEAGLRGVTAAALAAKILKAAAEGDLINAILDDES